MIGRLPQWILVVSAAGALTLGTSGCRFYYQEKNPSDLLNATLDAAQISYQTVHRQVLGPRCVACHGNSGGITLDSYTTVKANLNAIERTALAQKTMPKSGPLSPREAALLSAWIKAGAPEFTAGPKPPPELEEPIRPEFESIKKNVFQARCMACHTQGGSASGVLLNTREDLLNSPRELVLPGNPDESGLVLAVERNDNKRMPPPESGPKLREDECAAIRKWIENGGQD